jgi:hypothetical protein
MGEACGAYGEWKGTNGVLVGNRQLENQDVDGRKTLKKK